MIKIILLFSQLIITANADMHEEEWIVYSTATTGIPQWGNTNDLAMDQNGYLWVGTNHGLTRFDGIRWKVYLEENSELPDSRINAIAIDHEQNIWFATTDGVAVFDGDAWQLYNSSNSPVPHFWINEIYVDQAGTVWIATRGSGGLVSFDGNEWEEYSVPAGTNAVKIINGTVWAGTGSGVYLNDGEDWEQYNTDNSDLPHNSVNAIKTDGEGNVFIGTNDGLVVLSDINDDDWEVYTSDNSILQHDNIVTLMKDQDGSMLIGTRGGGPYVYDRGEWSVIMADADIRSDRITSLFREDNGDLWIGTWDGIVHYDGHTYFEHHRENTGVPDDFITDIIPDPMGTTWFTTLGGGFVHFNGFPDEPVFNIYNPASGTFDYEHIRTVTIDHNGDVWIGTRDAGVVLYNADEFVFYNSSNSGIPNDDIWAIEFDRYGNMWLGTWGGGVAVYDGDTWTVYDSGNSGLPADQICNLKIVGDDIWIGTFDGGLVKYDGNNWHVWNTNNSGVPYDHVHDFDFDEQGNLWTAHFDEGGVGKLTGIDWSVYNVGNSSIPDDEIYTVKIDGHNNVLLGSGNEGFIRYDGFEWKVYNTNNSGISDDEVRNISIDSFGNIWLATRGGLSVFNEEGIAVSVYDILVHELPDGYRLYQNYPNPFNPETTISFEIPAGEIVTLHIYNSLGQKVETLIEEKLQAGMHTITWDATGHASGMYVYRLIAGEFTDSRKLIYLR